MNIVIYIEKTGIFGDFLSLNDGKKSRGNSLKYDLLRDVLTTGVYTLTAAGIGSLIGKPIGYEVTFSIVAATLAFTASAESMLQKYRNRL